MTAQSAKYRPTTTGRLIGRTAPLILVTLLTVTWGLFVTPAVRPAVAQPPSTDHSDDRHIYVPIEDLDVVLERIGKQGVLLPRDEFRTLYDSAQKNRDAAAQLPRPFVVSSAAYSAQPDGERLTLTAELSITQFTAGWQAIPLPFENLSIEKATIAGNPALLGRLPSRNRTGHSPLILFNETVGQQTLTLELSTPLNVVGSDRVAAFSFVNVPAATLTVDIPAGKHLQIDDLSLERPTEIDQPANYTLAMGGKSQLALRITDRQLERSADSLLFATTAFGINVTPGEVTWQALTSLQVFGTRLDRLVCAVPRNLEITNVDSTGLEAWELAHNPENPQQTLVTLNYRQSFEGTRKIEFRGVMATSGDAPWSVPTLTLKSVTSHVGRIIVQHPPGVRLRSTKTDGVRQVPQTDTQPAPGTPQSSQIQLHYEVWRENFDLQFTTAPKDREVQAGMSTILDINGSGLDLQLVATIESFFAPLFEINLTLPADWAIRNALINNAAFDWQIIPQEAGQHQVRIPLKEPLMPGTEIRLTLAAHRDLEVWPIVDEPALFELPEIRLPQAAVVEGVYVIKADNDLDVVAVDLSGLDAANIRIAGQRLGYSYQDTRFSGKLRVARKPSRVSVRTFTITRLEEKTLHSHLEARLDVQGGGVRTLNVALSESAGTDLRFGLFRIVTNDQGTTFQPVRIVEQQASEPANGTRVWKLQLDQRLLGDALLTTDVTVPRGNAQSFQPHSIQIRGAERTNGYIAIEAAGDQRLSLTATASDGIPLDTVDPVDLPSALYVPQERIIAAYRYVAPGYQVTLSEERYDRIAVPTAICRESQLLSVLGQTGEGQHRARFTLTAVGIQSLQMLLPTTDETQPAQLWATLVDGQPVEVRKATVDGRTYLVPFPTGGQADATHTLEVYYRTQREPLDRFGHLRQQPLELTVVNGAGLEQPVEILEQDWTVHYPEETLLTDSRGEFRTEEPLDRTSLLGQFQQGFEITTPANMWQHAVAVAVAILIIGVLVTGYRRMGCLGFIAASAVSAILVIAFFTVSSSPREASREFFTAIDEDMSTAATPGGFADTQIDEHFNFAGDRVGYFGISEDESASDKAESSEGIPLQRATAAKSESKDANGRAERFDKRTQSNRERARSSGAIAGLDSLQESTRAGTNILSDNLTTLPGTPAPMGEPTAPPTDKPADQAFGVLAPFEAELSLQIRQQQQVADDGIQPGLAVAQAPDDALNALAEQAPRQERENLARRGRGGLLSLSLEIEPTPGSSVHEFHYAGTRTAREGISLDLTYENRTAGDAGRLFVILSVAFFYWMLRRRRLGTRALFGAMGIATPLALVSIAPIGWYLWLDGVFLGAVAGVLLWIIAALVAACETCCAPLLKRRSATQVGMLFLTALTLHGIAHDGLAQKTAPAQATTNRAQRRPPIVVPPRPPQTPPQPKLSTPSAIFPYDPAEDALTAERVFLPHAEYLRLWNLAHPEQQIHPPAPVDGLVAEALYSAKIETADGQQPTLLVTARMVIHNFRQQQITVPLPLGIVALQSAQLDGQPAAVRPQPTPNGGQFEVVVGSAGTHVLDLTFHVAIQATGSVGQFSLPLRPVSTGRLQLELPEQNLNVRVNGTTNVYRRLKQDEKTLIDIPIDNGGNITIAWQPEAAQGPTEGIVQAESTSAVVVDDIGVQFRSQWEFRVPQGQLADVSFTLPTTLRVQEISGPDVGGWEMAGTGEQRTIRVFFRRKVDDSTQLTFDLFIDVPLTNGSTNVTLPPFAPVNVTRDLGRLAIYAGEQFTVRALDTSGLIQMNVGTFTAPTQHERQLLAYRYTARPFQLQLQVDRRQAESRGAGDHAMLVERRKIRYTSRFQVSLMGIPRASVSLRVPDDFLPVSVKATDLADWYLTDAGDNGRLLTIEFGTPRTGTVNLVLQGTFPKNPDDATVTLSLPTFLDVNRLQTNLAVWLDETYRAGFETAEGWRSLDPTQLPGELQNRQPRPAQLAFTTGALTPTPIVLNLTRATPQVTPDSVSVITVTDTLTNYTLALNWRITLAAADTFTVITPDWLAGKLDFEGGNIRQVQEAEAGPGLVRWTITLQEPVRDRYFALATANLPPPTNEVRTPELTFEARPDGQPDGEFQRLEPQEHYVLLINQSRSRLEAVNPEGSRAVEPTGLPISLSQNLLDQATQLLQINRNALPPVWRVQRFEQQQGAPASVNIADITTVIAVDGTWRAQALYTIKNRARQFLALELPAGTRLLSLFVRDQPVRAVETTLGEKKIQLIPLPKTSASDLSFRVKVVFAGNLAGGPLPTGVRLQAESLDLPAPRVLSQTENSEFGIPVAKTLWTVYLPKDVHAAPLDDPQRNNFTLQENGSTQIAYQIDLYQEALSCVNVIEGAFSTVQQSRAKSNLKVLEKELESRTFSDLSGSLGYGTDTNRLSDLQESFQRKLKENADLLAETPVTDEYFGMMGDASQMEEATIQQQISGNNTDLFSANGIVDGDPNTASDAVLDAKGFNFFDVEQLAQAGKKVSSFGNQATAENRLLRRQQSLSNLEELNTTLEQQKHWAAPESRLGQTGRPMQSFDHDFTGEAAAQTQGGMSLQQQAPDGESFTFSFLQGGMGGGLGGGGGGFGGGGGGLGDMEGGFGGGLHMGAGAGGVLPQPPAAWTQVGGLSLKIDIPTDGQKLQFSKVSGDPKLALAIRPRKSLETGFGLLWTLLWLALGMVAATSIAKLGAWRSITTLLPLGLMVCGLVSIFMLPIPTAGLVIFVLGAAIYGFQHRHAEDA